MRCLTLMLMQKFLWCRLNCWWASIFLSFSSSYTIPSWHDFAFELIWYRGLATILMGIWERILLHAKLTCTPQTAIWQSIYFLVLLLSAEHFCNEEKLNFKFQNFRLVTFSISKVKLLYCEFIRFQQH